MRKLPIELPNKRNVEKLFKELNCYDFHEHYCPSHAKYKKLDEAEDAITKNLLESSVLKTLKKKKEAAYDEYTKEKKILQEKIRKCRQLFYAKGLTPEVLKKLEALVIDLNGK